MKTALVHHPVYQKHNTGPGHPEMPLRYDVVMEALREDDVFWQSLSEVSPAKASKGLIQAAHTPQHFKRVEGAIEHGLDRLDADTTISMQSFDAALYAAGGAVAGVDAVMEGEAKNAFVAVRPPGHHANARPPCCDGRPPGRSTSLRRFRSKFRALPFRKDVEAGFGGRG